MAVLPTHPLYHVLGSTQNNKDSRLISLFLLYCRFRFWTSRTFQTVQNYVLCCELSCIWPSLILSLSLFQGRRPIIRFGSRWCWSWVMSTLICSFLWSSWKDSTALWTFIRTYSKYMQHWLGWRKLQLEHDGLRSILETERTVTALNRNLNHTCPVPLDTWILPEVLQ